MLKPLGLALWLLAATPAIAAPPPSAPPKAAASGFEVELQGGGGRSFKARVTELEMPVDGAGGRVRFTGDQALAAYLTKQRKQQAPNTYLLVTPSGLEFVVAVRRMTYKAGKAWEFDGVTQ